MRICEIMRESFRLYRRCHCSTPVLPDHRISKAIAVILKDLWSGMARAIHESMKKLNLFTILLMLLWPAGSFAGSQEPEVNVNERYVVESVAFSGADLNKVSKALNDEAQKLVGVKYSEKTAHAIADKLRHNLGSYQVNVKVERGEKPDHVKVVFQIEKREGSSLGANVPLVLYHSKQGWSADLEIPFDSHHTRFTFGLLSDADQLLERNAGLHLRFEHNKLGTEKLQLRMDFDSYHQKFNPATETALNERLDVPGIYRTRQNFAPSLSLLPIKGLKASAGVSFQRFQMQYPELRTRTAYAGTADLQYQRRVKSKSKYEQDISAVYSLRTATRALDSDFVYSRHLFTADYSISSGKNFLGAHLLIGAIGGTAPLFERFSLGNSTTLRGWNKFDVAPLGGTRAAHGSLDYHYGQFQLFYDVGTVWDEGRYSQVRHGIGFGWASKPMLFGSKFFASLAFPVRLHNVAPVFMMGIRY